MTKLAYCFEDDGWHGSLYEPVGRRCFPEPAIILNFRVTEGLTKEPGNARC